MAWRREIHGYRSIDHSTTFPGAFRLNPKCYIRKEHECGKVFGASKSCFIACPTDDELDPMLSLISEKLMKHGIEPIIAVKDRAYGQDIFCTKICGKILESRFCLVILDDAIVKDQNIPNPNVYYEYGLMTALGKHIVPLQKEGLKLAFNIQSYDTIEYTAKNVSAELERAIRDAIRITESQAEKAEPTRRTEKVILRKLELAGFTAKDHGWFLNDVIEDTSFRGFGNDRESCYVYIGKINSEADAESCLEDLDVVLKRTENVAESLLKQIEDDKKKLSEYEKKLETATRIRAMIPYNAEKLREEIPENERKLSRMKKMYMAFIIDCDMNVDAFKKRVEESMSAYPRFEPSYSVASKLGIGAIEVDLSDIKSRIA
jgi:hypothetical protein